MRRRTKRINLVLLSESVKHNRQKNKSANLHLCTQLSTATNCYNEKQVTVSLSGPHALCSLSQSLRPHEPLSETRLESLLLIFWKVFLLYHLVQRLRLDSFFFQEQSLRGEKVDM